MLAEGMPWLAWLLQWVLTQFSLAMLFVAVAFIIFHVMVRIKYVSFYEIVFRWIALFPLGLTGLYTFYMHAFHPAMAAAVLNWSTSPFQFEVAMADLAFGVLGIMAFKARYDFRLATVLGSMIFLWGAAIGHVDQMAVNQNYAPGNAGSWFWLDLFIPLILIFCIMKLKPKQK